VTEEIVFRSALVPLHLLAKIAPKHIVFYTPLYFGIAHIHHFYEYTLTHPHTAFAPALIRSIVQFCYTTIFGFYASFVFLRTGSLWAVMLQHSFCNWCGLPRFWGRVDATPLGPPATGEGEHQSAATLGVGWTVTYYVLLLAGAVAFGKGLWPLTDSKRALVEFGKS
jgi:prenyl protein peptidase